MSDHTHHHVKQGSNILIAFFLNAGFAVIEFIGGWLTNSMAIYSDALHDLGDSIALLFAWFSEKLSHKEADASFTYGYRRFSVMAAFVNGIILMTGSLFVIYEAILRINQPEPVKPEGMLVLALLGIIVNGVAAFRLSKGSGMNQRMVMYHLMEDIMGWIAVLIVSVVLLFRPFYILDSILSILISFVILRGVYKNIKKVGAIFLQKFPDELEMDTILDEIKSQKLVIDVHAVRGWAIDDEFFYLSLHIEVPEKTTVKTTDDLRNKISEVLSKHNIKYSSIEFESCCQDHESL